jgi:hypothetical protein
LAAEAHCCVNPALDKLLLSKKGKGGSFSEPPFSIHSDNLEHPRLYKFFFAVGDGVWSLSSGERPKEKIQSIL